MDVHVGDVLAEGAYHDQGIGQRIERADPDRWDDVGRPPFQVDGTKPVGVLVARNRLWSPQLQLDGVLLTFSIRIRPGVGRDRPRD